MRFVTHLESPLDGTRYDGHSVQTMHQSRPLCVRYDLEQVKRQWTVEPLSGRPSGMWRYRELLPVGTDISPVTLGKTTSPLIECPRLAAALGLRQLLIKDESQLPTASFKCRGLAMAVTMAQHFGLRRLAMSSNGNAASALAMYAARGGIEAWVVMPEDVNRGNLFECWISGAQVYLANGLIDECGKLVRRGHDQGLWFDVSTLKEPYRLEGKKTMGLEIAEQLNWVLPDVILYPTGGGTALIGMWKAFCELREMGWLKSAAMPRMIAVQSDGCCPIVRAFDRNQRFAERHPNAHSAAFGIRVPQAIGDFMMLDVLRDSQGAALAVPEQELEPFQRLGCNSEGLSVGLETSACLAAVRPLLDQRWIRPDERIVIVNTASATKYWPDELPGFPRLDLASEIDLGEMIESLPRGSASARRVLQP
jgi:threonine synthase